LMLKKFFKPQMWYDGCKGKQRKKWKLLQNN